MIGRFFDHYFEINEGIGVNKSPELYGAFPTDPYSHTPRGEVCSTDDWSSKRGYC